MEQLYLREKSIENKTILEVEGTLNSFTYTDFKEKLFSLIEKKSVTIDMSKINDLNSEGISVLLSAFEIGEEKENELCIANPSDSVLTAIDSTGFAYMFKIHRK